MGFGLGLGVCFFSGEGLGYGHVWAIRRISGTGFRILGAWV